MLSKQEIDAELDMTPNRWEILAGFLYALRELSIVNYGSAVRIHTDFDSLTMEKYLPIKGFIYGRD